MQVRVQVQVQVRVRVRVRTRAVGGLNGNDGRLGTLRQDLGQVRTGLHGNGRAQDGWKGGDQG